MNIDLKINISDVVNLKRDTLYEVIKLIDLDSLKFLDKEFFHEIDLRVILNMASKRNDVEYVQKFIDSGFDVSKKYKDVTPLMSACAYNCLDVSQLLIKNNVDLDLTSENLGMTALALATFNNCYECAKLLIESGADLNIENKEGDTALSIAKSKFRNKISDLLIEYGTHE